MMPEFFARHVRVRAYYLSLERERLGLPSDHLADWVQAEREFGLAPGIVSDLISRLKSYLKVHEISAEVFYEALKTLFRIPVSYQPLLT